MTQRILLRMGRRRTIEETISVDEFYGLLFPNGDDLCPSVYDIDSTECSRATAEHTASLLSDPPRGVVNFDYLGLPETLKCSIAKTPGATKFQFTVEQHRELLLNSGNKDEERARIQALCLIVRGELALRRRQTSLNDIRNYVRNCIAQNDPEWIRFEANTTSTAWKKLCR